MEYDLGIVLINSSEIISVVRRALSKIDERLIEHGERVGYIARKIYEASPDQSDMDPSILYLLCLLHDIGAYKTDEIDHMVRFETEHSFDHSLYGYLFLKNTTHLAPYSEALLYHHTDYSKMKDKMCACANYAEMIFLADRTDILLLSPHPDLAVIRAMSGTKFNPIYVSALMKAEAACGFSENVRSGAYRRETLELLSDISVQSSEIIEYLKLLVYAMDFRSPYTVTHTADTTILSMEIGKLLGLSPHELQSLYMGAFLHDIGKIAIPYDILEKPGKLTPDEYAVVQRHIPEGEAILRGIVSDEICDIALRHHEKLDGSGYSRGLRAASLTLPQRIVAVADILSALTQRRSYKEPFPREKVLAILTDMRNTGLLCPTVVDTVCEHYALLMRDTEVSHDPIRTLYQNLRREYSERANVQ